MLRSAVGDEASRTAGVLQRRKMRFTPGGLGGMITLKEF
jgi:hypothetical protein